MKAIKPTAKDIDFECLRLPFAIDQSNYTNDIRFFSSAINYDTKSFFTVAVFRVYPKGQNPNALKRREGYVKWQRPYDGRETYLHT